MPSSNLKVLYSDDNFNSSSTIINAEAILINSPTYCNWLSTSEPATLSTGLSHLHYECETLRVWVDGISIYLFCVIMTERMCASNILENKIPSMIILALHVFQALPLTLHICFFLPQGHENAGIRFRGEDGCCFSPFPFMRLYECAASQRKSPMESADFMQYSSCTPMRCYVEFTDDGRVYKCSTIAAGTYTFLVNAMVFLLYDSTPLAHGEINCDWYLGRRTIFRDFEFYLLDCMCMCSRRSFNSSPICMDREDDSHMRASRKS